VGAGTLDWEDKSQYPKRTFLEKERGGLNNHLKKGEEESKEGKNWGERHWLGGFRRKGRGNSKKERTLGPDILRGDHRRKKGR